MSTQFRELVRRAAALKDTADRLVDATLDASVNSNPPRDAHQRQADVDAATAALDTDVAALKTEARAALERKLADTPVRP